MSMPSADRIIAEARLRESQETSGRLPMPSYADWPSFPFEGEIVVKAVADAQLPEPARSGADGAECHACARSDADCIWVDDNWRLAALDEPSGLPVVVLLEPRAHHDLGDLPPRLVDDLGRMMWRVERAIASLDHVGRVHVMRIGDGAEHLHVWFLARPAGLVQGRGSFLTLWDDILPPRPVDEWRASLAAVAEAMSAEPA